jgi:hypothetical protein
MISEQPVLNLLRFDTFDSGVWVPWSAVLNEFEINRGGKRSGVVTTVEPGMLSATLIGADPATDSRLRPNVPIRVVTPYTRLDEFDAVNAGMTLDELDALWAGKTLGQFDSAFTPLFPVFTGSVLDLASTFSIDKRTGKKTRVTTLTATDAVQSHAATPRHGAVSSGVDEFETWAQRILRLTSSAVTEVQPPADDSPIVRYAL